MRKIFQTLTALALLLYALAGMAVEIKVTVDRNPVNLNESFQITFTAEQSPDDDPDFRPLEQNFEIISQSQNSQFSLLNGTTSRTNQWILMVIAKQSGSLQIPEVSFGRDKSQLTSILVNATTTSQPGTAAGRDLFLQVKVSKQNVYVQSQFIYTLRLYRKVNLAQARLTEPEVTDAVIEKLGEDKNYNTQFKGQKYIVTERQYAIFPQKSGLLTLPSIVLTAAIIVDKGRSRFNGFFNRQTTRTKRVMSASISINVLPVPAEFKNRHWLPAEQLHLEQTWSGDISQIRVGEPLTRTLTILAKGTTVGQLPELNQMDITIQTDSGGELKNYPDQPLLKEQAKEGSIYAFREEKIAFIPSKAGTYHLPEISIPWWNSNTQQLEISTIPATTLIAIQSGQDRQEQTAYAVENKSNATANAVKKTPQSTQNTIWIGLAVFFAMAWLVTLLYFLNPRKPDKIIDPTDTQDITLAKSIKAIRQACKNNDPTAAKDALIQWGRQKFNVSNIGRIAEFCDVRLRDEILILNQLLYGQSVGQWEGRKFMQAFTENTAREKLIRTEDSGLEPLYRL